MLLKMSSPYRESNLWRDAQTISSDSECWFSIEPLIQGIKLLQIWYIKLEEELMYSPLEKLTPWSLPKDW